MIKTLDITRLGPELDALDAPQGDAIPTDNGNAQGALHPAPAPGDTPQAIETPAILELRALPQWVGCKYPNKAPLNPHTGYGASTVDPKTWGTFQQARAAMARYGWDTTGPSITQGDGYAMIDLDHCASYGVIKPWALEIVEMLSSYTEYSPSYEHTPQDHGVRIVCKGEIPKGVAAYKGNPSKWKNDKDLQLPGVPTPPLSPEIYSSKRWITITGFHVAGTPTTIERRQNQLAQLRDDTLEQIATHKANVEAVKHPKKSTHTSPSSGAGLSPGDDFSARVESPTALLEKHGWVTHRARGDEIPYTRPNKDARAGISAQWNVKKRTFYNFSGNASPFDADESYSIFAVYALLEHGGDFGVAAKRLAAQGYGTPRRAGRAADAPPPWQPGAGTDDGAPPVDADGGDHQGDYLERHACEANALVAELETIAAKRAAAKKANADAPALDLSVEYAYEDVYPKLCAIARGLKAGPRGRLADAVKATGAIGKTEFLRDVRGDVGTMSNGRLQAEPLTTAVYADLYRKWGYRFRQNLLNDDLENNGVYFTDPQQDLLISKVRDHGIENADRIKVSVEHAKEAIVVAGLARAFHPVKDYLGGLQWDKQDHIKELAGHFKSADNLFEPWFRHWICGSVARVLCGGYQVPMLTLGGAQNLGKSHFARWVCPLPTLFHEGPIAPNNRDCVMRQADTFVWEVSELGSTTKKADVDALKFFVTKTYIRDRKPYGRRDTRKPALANYIGTFNYDGAGFLVDQTGNRRFLVTNLTDIDWGYTALDVDQLWAQAVNIVQAGDDWKLTPEQVRARDETNEEYLISDPTKEALVELFEFTGNKSDTLSADGVLRVLHAQRGFRTDRATAVQIGKALRVIEQELAVLTPPKELTRERKQREGVRRTVYRGMKLRQPPNEKMGNECVGRLGGG